MLTIEASEGLTSQFVLCLNENIIPDLWKKYHFNGKYLGVHASLNVVHLVNAKNKKALGFIIGYPIYKNRLLKGEYSIDVQEDWDMTIETEIYQKIAGRFVFLVLTDISFRFYIDPIGSLSALYNPHAKIVFSTMAAVGITSNTPDFIKEMEEDKFRWGYTRFQNVFRILPNHYLDLNEWSLTRHYPTFSCTPGENKSIDNNLDIITREIEGIAIALTNEGIYMSLTAGADSRMVLACCRNIKELIVFVKPINNDEEDKIIAEKIISKYNLKYIDLKGIRECTTDEKMLFDNILGYTGSGLSYLPKDISDLKKNAFHVTGVSGELSRGRLYDDGDFNNQERIEVKDLVNRMKLKETSDNIKCCENFLNTIPPDLSRFQILDLFLIEQSFSLFAGPETYPYDAFTIPSIHVFSSRKIVEAFINLPARYKYTRNVTAGLCKKNWPDLLEFPINGILYS